MTHRSSEDLFDVPAAARYAATSKDTIRRRLRAGGFPRARRGSRSNDPWLIPEGDLIAAGLVAAPRHGVARRDLVGHVAVLREMAASLTRQADHLEALIYADPDGADGLDAPVELR
ncbi:MAG TPA: hypothetical protein VHD87_15115 [Acidimicrobiales bacterium]|nr:hypothetical protein [Acidimicrobiales bacterium]